MTLPELTRNAEARLLKTVGPGSTPLERRAPLARHRGALGSAAKPALHRRGGHRAVAEPGLGD